MNVLVGATVTVCYNTITNSYGSTGFFDAYNSKLTFCGNRISNVIDFAGIIGEQSVYESSTLPSTVYITDSQILHLGGVAPYGANGVYLYDWGTVSTLSTPNIRQWHHHAHLQGRVGAAGTLNAVVSGNTLQTDTSCGCYNPLYPEDYSVIISGDLKSLVVSQNTILGGGAAGVYVYRGPAMVSGNAITGSYDGVWLDPANDTHVTGNVIKNSAQYGIALTDGSSYNLVTGNHITTSGTFDLYWDQTGTGNTWHGNQYQTSSPPGLG